jgi:hypothetical protein
VRRKIQSRRNGGTAWITRSSSRRYHWRGTSRRPLSSSQIYRLVAEQPERLSLKVLMALLDILDCSMDELIEPIPAATSRRWVGPRAGLRICARNGPDRRSRW